MFKTGQKIVCVVKGEWSKQAKSNGFMDKLRWLMNSKTYGPKYNEVVEVKGTHYDEYVDLVEYSKNGRYDARCFKPIDLAFGEEKAEEIANLIKEEELTVTI